MLHDSLGVDGLFQAYLDALILIFLYIENLIDDTSNLSLTRCKAAPEQVKQSQVNIIHPVGIGREYVRDNFRTVAHQSIKNIVGLVFIRPDHPGVNGGMVAD